MVSEQDFERLSAYIDDELSQTERVTLEARLREDPALQRELDELRLIVGAVRGMAVPRRPRDFRLTPEMVAPPRSPRFLVFPATRLVSALSTAAAVAMIAIGGAVLLLSGGQSGAVVQNAPAAVAVGPTVPAPVTPEQTPLGAFSADQDVGAAGDAPPVTREDDAADVDDAVAGDVDTDEEAQEELEAGELLFEAENADEMEDVAEADLFDAESTEAIAPAGAMEDDGLLEADAAAADIAAPTPTREPLAAADEPPAPPNTGRSLAAPTASPANATSNATVLPTASPAGATFNATVLPTVVAQAPIEEVPPPTRPLPTMTPALWSLVFFGFGGAFLMVGLGTFIRWRATRGRA